MRKIKFILVYFLFVLLTVSLLSNEDECRDCSTHPTKECCDEMPWLEICQPDKENDHADDNFSFSVGNTNKLYFITPDVLIYRRGHYKVYENNNFGENEDAFTDLKESAEVLLKSGNILILPTGSLLGKENDTMLRYTLEEYVRNGGFLIVLCQQYQKQYSVIPKEAEEPLRAVGWRETESCTWGSVYFEKENMHPILSAMTNEKVSMPVDI